MNHFRQKAEKAFENQLLEEQKKPALKNAEQGSTTVFFRKLFIEGVVSKQAAMEMLPYIIFLCVLVMIYIANSHMAEKNIRNIDKLGKEVKELSWEYKSLKADLMFKSKMTEVAKKVDTLNLKELIEPPKKLVISKNEY